MHKIIPDTYSMKRGRTYKTKVNVAKRQKQFAAAKQIAPVNNKFTASKKQGPELKNLDQVQTLTITQASAAFSPLVDLNVVAQGTTAETRIGRKMVMKALFFRWNCNLGLTSTGGSSIRWLIVYDKQTNAAAPGQTDVLTTNTFLSPMNLANSERFVVLKSWITEPLSVNNNFSVAGECYIPMALETVFNDNNAGTPGDIQTGGVFVMASQDGQIGTANGSASFYSRIRFEDA